MHLSVSICFVVSLLLLSISLCFILFPHLLHHLLMLSKIHAFLELIESLVSSNVQNELRLLRVPFQIPISRLTKHSLFISWFWSLDQVKHKYFFAYSTNELTITYLSFLSGFTIWKEIWSIYLQFSLHVKKIRMFLCMSSTN